ncbi:hypothetical protein FRC91_18205 [Bradymonadales bacterium TMQ1]|nr:hypothetical protein FRC91_18205 [Bradymonadales bacterium TMQ1]
MDFDVLGSGRWAVVIIVAFFVSSCFGAKEDRYVVVHQPIRVYNSVGEAERGASRMREDVKVAFVLSQGERVRYIDDGYTKQFMYIRIEAGDGKEGYILNSPQIDVVKAN